ncbi:Survival protein sure-like phosphatase/nucleotidase [Mycena sanguinolenta]|uniref:Survival protein sure-like phosphatase/nucleotidase n=1 Tax=Mycena sanguinolenta TaxID=230812 RepID=A0A8H6Z9V4_9AGAR|nr:Survival protein sure-like phosphatase/nucleotidase [Mycena sanguinolenta]KAF7373324.1 Survival protein sure-like phosphatase/nucleotidase [Mycena sanguinolenta]
MQFLALVALACAVSAQTVNKIVLTNDDGCVAYLWLASFFNLDVGWAVAQIRAQNDALNAAGYNVVLSCPANNESGTGSSSETPTTLESPCEFDTCPTGSPATGFNTTDPRLNYVNAFPVDAARFGIQTLAPEFFNGSKPDFVVSGPNVGNNLGLAVLFSGTIGAASEAALEGIPSAAFSGATGDEVSYTTLTTAPASADSEAAVIYSALTVSFLDVLLASSAPILPSGISLNVNYPSTTSCTSVSDFKFVLTRIFADPFVTDVNPCGNPHLPTESSVISMAGCFATVSVFDASTKLDANAANQAIVLDKLASILTCIN